MTHGSVQTRYGVRELLPRLVCGFVLSHFGAQLCQLLITTANALTRAWSTKLLPGPQAAQYAQARIAAASTDLTAGVCRCGPESRSGLFYSAHRAPLRITEACVRAHDRGLKPTHK